MLCYESFYADFGGQHGFSAAMRHEVQHFLDFCDDKYQATNSCFQMLCNELRALNSAPVKREETKSEMIDHLNTEDYFKKWQSRNWYNCAKEKWDDMKKQLQSTCDLKGIEQYKPVEPWPPTPKKP